MLLRQIILRARGAHGDSLDGRISVSKLLGNPSLVAYAVWESGAECLDTDFYWGLLCLSYECVINVNSICLQGHPAAVLFSSSILRQNFWCKRSEYALAVLEPCLESSNQLGHDSFLSFCTQTILQGFKLLRSYPQTREAEEARSVLGRHGKETYIRGM